MKTKLIITIIFILRLGIVLGQNGKYLSLELGGSGGLGSLNYETEFYQKENVNLFFRTGFSFVPIDKNNGTALIFPQMIHGTYGKKMHQADLGLGLAPSITSNLGGAYVRVPLSFGYRFQPDGKNYYLRIAYTPLLSFLLDLQWEHWVGITYAYKFKTQKDSK